MGETRAFPLLLVEAAAPGQPQIPFVPMECIYDR